MRGERAPLLASRHDLEAAGTSGESGGDVVADERSRNHGVDHEVELAHASTTSRRRRTGVVFVVASVVAVGLMAVASGGDVRGGVGGGVTGVATLGSHHESKHEIVEGSTKHCENAAADNAAGTFQVQSKDCADSTALPGCVGKRSVCRFCQTHMATNRNHDWPLCPALLCEEKSVYGCKGSKKESKREIAWRVLREHVLDHNKMVDGVKIGKCSTNTQDRDLGRFMYHDEQCETQGLPGCMATGNSPCRFCNVKDAKKANRDWPDCPLVVCEKYKHKSSKCVKLKKYDVPSEHPPEDWDMKGLPDEIHIGDDEEDEEDDDEYESGYQDADGDDDDDSESQRTHKKIEDEDDEDEEPTTHSLSSSHQYSSHHHHRHHHHGHSNDDDDDDDDDDDNSYYNKDENHPVESEKVEKLGQEEATEELEEQREKRWTQATDLDSQVFDSFGETQANAL